MLTFVETLLKQNQIKFIQLKPDIPIIKNELVHNTSLVYWNNKYIQENAIYRQLMVTIYCMLKYVKYDICLIKKYKTLFVNDKCLLPKCLILKILKYIRKDSIKY